MYSTEINEYLDKEIDRCKKHYNDSYNTQTRIKWMERENMFVDMKAAINNYTAVKESLNAYQDMDRRCKEKYGSNIATQLGI